MKIVILGAGLAGLSAAYHLSVNSRSTEWTIIEKLSSVGGTCRSANIDGFIFDKSIHVLYPSDKYSEDLITMLLADNILINKREAWVYSNGVYTRYPWQVNTYGLPCSVVKECLMGFIHRTKGNNSNFREWCHSYLGEGFANHFMIPYNSKLWATDLNDMTAEWIDGRVVTPEMGDVIEGALCRKSSEYGLNVTYMYPSTGGIESLPVSFLSHIDSSNILLNTTVKYILWKDNTVLTDSGEFRYDRLITSLPMPFLVEHMKPSPLKGVMHHLKSNVVNTVNIAVKGEPLLPYHWLYVPEKKYLLHRVSFPGNLSCNMAPDGYSTLTVEISSSPSRPLPCNYVDVALSELRSMNILNGKFEVICKEEIDPAYVIYNHTHRSETEKTLHFLSSNGIYACGRFGEWKYLNMDASIMSGRKAALMAMGAMDDELQAM